jgi:hypothetical protein
MNATTGSDKGDGNQPSDSTLDKAIAKVPTPANISTEFPSSSDDKAKKAKTDKPKRQHHWLRWLIVILVVAALSGGVYFLLKQDYLNIKFGQHANRAFAEVCSDEIQQQFWQYNIQVEFPTDNVKALYEEIISKKNYDKDPNCLFMAFRYETRISFDAAAAQEKLNKLIELNEQGINPSPKYTDVQNLTAMQTIIRSITPVEAEE